VTHRGDAEIAEGLFFNLPGDAGKSKPSETPLQIVGVFSRLLDQSNGFDQFKLIFNPARRAEGFHLPASQRQMKENFSAYSAPRAKRAVNNTKCKRYWK
jgi:hypothetical protein